MYPESFRGWSQVANLQRSGYVEAAADWQSAIQQTGSLRYFTRRMISQPRIGTSHEMMFIVDDKHVIDFAGDGMPAVLSTPILIGLLERTARQALAPYLEGNERSVGAEIELRHFAPTPPGQQVTCVARVIGTEGRSVTFQIEARDQQETIARGVHKRAVIRTESFARRVQAKKPS